eukprot:7623253-Alexandrium_andersonii.AAC.1
MVTDLCSRLRALGHWRRHPQMPDREDAILYMTMVKMTRTTNNTNEFKGELGAKMNVEGEEAAHALDLMKDSTLTPTPHGLWNYHNPGTTPGQSSGGFGLHAAGAFPQATPAKEETPKDEQQENDGPGGKDSDKKKKKKKRKSTAITEADMGAAGKVEDPKGKVTEWADELMRMVKEAGSSWTCMSKLEPS